MNLDGEGFKRLTEGTGDHLVQLAPSKRCFLDQHSSVTRPPVTEVRSAEGEHLLTLSEADTSALEAFGWLPGEEFTVKADDGKEPRMILNADIVASYYESITTRNPVATRAAAKA